MQAACPSPGAGRTFSLAARSAAAEKSAVRSLQLTALKESISAWRSHGPAPLQGA